MPTFQRDFVWQPLPIFLKLVGQYFQVYPIGPASYTGRLTPTSIRIAGSAALDFFLTMKTAIKQVQ